MPLDALTLSCLSRELNNTLSGGRVNKITQPEPDEIVLSIFARGREHNLLMSAGTGNPRIHICKAVKKNPLAAPAFCMHLRKYLSGAILSDITLQPFERAVRLNFKNKNELKDTENLSLIIEIMGKHSNIIFVNDKDKIIDCIKQIPFDVSSVRQILPGLSYKAAPSQDKINLTDLKSFEALMKNFEGGNPSGLEYGRFLSANLRGVSYITALEIAYRAGTAGIGADGGISNRSAANACTSTAGTAQGGIGADGSAHPCTTETEADGAATAKTATYPAAATTAAKIISAANAFYQNSLDAIEPSVYYDDELNPTEFTFTPYRCLGQNFKAYGTLSEAVEAYYFEKDRRLRFSEKSKNLLLEVKNLVARNEKTLNVLNDRINDCRDLEQNKIIGDLLSSNLHILKQGAELAELNNFYDESGGTLKIRLNKNLSPAKNAQAYYKKYTKQKKTLTMSAEQLSAVKKKLEYLYDITDSFRKSTEADELEQIRRELVAENFISKQKEKQKNGRSKPPDEKRLKFKPYAYLADGFKIYAGKNNLQNEFVTFEAARDGDLWLHVKNDSGSHVVIKQDEKNAPDGVITVAAQIAAYYSKSYLSKKVEVDYCLKKFVKKIKGGGIGNVTYTNFKTRLSEPKEHKELLV
jgi:predicted ribosome quality control (RQC) complex YloA/Tae2 family protein